MIDRRTFLSVSGAAAAMSGPALASTCGQMPAEWEPHAGCVMTWCSAVDTYGEDTIAAIRVEQTAIARAIATFEPVTMLVNPGEIGDTARQLGSDIGVEILEHNDMWARDTLPTPCRTARTGTSWNFNTWGEKYPGYEADRTLSARYAEAKGLTLATAGVIAEGGALETDGRGTLLTTETCLLNENRNPGMPRAEVEAALKDASGCDHVIWLWGSEADFVTDGHVDGLARFFRPGLVVVEVTDDKEDPEYRDLQENALRLEAARDARGEPLEVIRLNRPRWEEMPERGPDFAPSYLNSYFPNGGIIMPKLGDEIRDEAARALFAKLMPDRRIVQLEINHIAEAGGGIHCCTMNVPA